MRLINVETFKLEEFFGDAIPKYAILSHTWGNDDEEITFRDIEAGRIEKSGSGSPKVKGCCNQAKQDGLEYVWIDTCCIDKTSAVELGESINSMFHWYRKASLCYAYLFDVPTGDNPRQPDSKFFSSRWFTRGWTLQELLAPKKLCFYDHNWDLLGTKHNLSGVIQTITGVPRPFLIGLATLRDASVAQRMSWAANRRTKREEDLAYCLLGIFGVMMPMIYGEGDRAFIRLQEEIMKHGGDDSILAWGLDIDGSGSGSSAISKGILAAAPSDFATCGQIVSGTLHTTSIEISGGRLKIHLPVHATSTGKVYGLMKCQPERDDEQVVGVPLEKVDGPSHNYIRPIGQRPILLPRATPDMTANLVSIGKDQKPGESSRNRQHWFYIEEPYGIDLELIDVEPRDRWRKDQSMIATEDASGADAVQHTLARFRSKKDMSTDLVIVLECYTAPVRVQFYTMSLSGYTPLAAVSRKLDYLLPKAAGKHSISIGAIHVSVSVRRESIASQSMFVVSLASMPDPVDFTVDASSELRVLESKADFVELLEKEESLYSTLFVLSQQVREQETALKEKKGKISAIREMISKLQEEERLLVEEIQKPMWDVDNLIAEKDERERHLDDAIDQIFEKQQQLVDDPRIGTADIANMLLTKKADPGPTNQSSQELLQEAVTQNCLAAVALLLDSGVDVNTMDRKDNTPLHRASSQGNTVIARRLLERGAIPILENKNGSTPLHSASARGKTEVAWLLLDSGADISAKDRKGYTPLHTASSWGQVKVARLLLERGADIGAKHHKGSTPLHCAASRGHPEVAQLLLDHGADVGAWGGHGWRPLHCASSWGNIEVARILLDRGAPVDDTTRDKWTPLHFATKNGHMEIARLLTNHGANGNAKNEDGDTPSSLAAEREKSVASDRKGAL